MRSKPAIPKQFLGAFKAGHRKSAREFIDEELSYQLLSKIIASNYEDKESIKNLEYITRFNNEFHKNVVLKDGKALHTSEQLSDEVFLEDYTPKEGSKRKGHKAGETMTMKQQMTHRENVRNRDITSLENDRMLSIEPQVSESEGGQSKIDQFLNSGRDLHSHEDTILGLLEAPPYLTLVVNNED